MDVLSNEVAENPPKRSRLLTVSIGRVVVVNTPWGFVVATQHNEMALVVRIPAEALLSNGEEAAIFDRTWAKITQQQDCIH